MGAERAAAARGSRPRRAAGQVESAHGRGIVWSTAARFAWAGCLGPLWRPVSEAVEPTQSYVPPPESSAERWAFDYVSSCSLAYKLSPPNFPAHFLEGLRAQRISSPGRPAELRRATQRVKTPSTDALRDPRRRASLLHTFWHHELQAAELMCWAVLAFPETPEAFKRGLLQICLDEIRHMQLYVREIERLGCHVGEFPVSDWFWSRVPTVLSASGFLAAMGLGFEAGNLDHTQRFSQRFRAAGDARCAELQELVALEEIGHVAFAAHWFRAFEGELSFEGWRNALPAPLTPMVMRGRPLARTARTAAGLDDAFLDALERW
jgi:uncharacterized ferritin-like protein (DUF455 family)